MVKITDIPPEILIKFAQLGANLPHHLADESKRRAFLRHFCLVHSTWRHPGQSVLWRDIKFDGSWNRREPEREAMQRFAESTATKRGILATALYLGPHVGKESIGRMMDSCTGIRRLTLTGSNQIELGVLLEKGQLAGEPFACTPNTW